MAGSAPFLVQHDALKLQQSWMVVPYPSARSSAREGGVFPALELNRLVAQMSAYFLRPTFTSRLWDVNVGRHGRRVADATVFSVQYRNRE
jgi:hypothetical protein